MDFLQRGMKMLIISSYPPRECGLATFSNDIIKSVRNVFGSSLPIEICALQQNHEQYEYGEEVTYILSNEACENYRDVSEQINQRNDIGLVCIQHEFGLFGGENGDYVLALLLSLNKPVVTVFHTVLPSPNDGLHRVVSAIANLSQMIVVLTNLSQSILQDSYGVNPSKITVIPHGTHMVLWQDKQQLKKQHQCEGKLVMSTFGLLSRNKSVETVLHALPKIIEQHPNVLYLVIGKTHPEVIKKEGQEYRESLLKTVAQLHLQDNVRFINQFLGIDELLAYLSLSDIYLFSSKDPNQAVSGTLAYALSCGCAVISTPIPHAREALDGGGILLEHFENPGEFETAILSLIDHPDNMAEMGRNAYARSHATVWENIAIKYGLLFGKLANCEDHLRFRLPPLKLKHIEAMTTGHGMLQFSQFSQPDPGSGYTLDDNARALIDVVMYVQHKKDPKAIRLASIYLGFIEGIQRESGLFDNYRNYEGQITDQNLDVNLEDSNGRAFWSLGFTIAHHSILPSDLVRRAERCWAKAIPNIDAVTSPRAIAYTIKGLYQYYTVHPTPSIRQHIKTLADALLHHYQINSGENWYWYEDYMTYANNILPEAMMYSYMATHEDKYREIAIMSLDFLLSHYFMKGELKVISNNGWFKKENERAFFGEQPMEVATTIVALDLFYSMTGNEKYKNQLEVAFSWFLGNNHLKQIMYNTANGASYDGLEDQQVNINQGAESVLCFFKVQMIMEKYTASTLSFKAEAISLRAVVHI